MDSNEYTHHQKKKIIHLTTFNAENLYMSEVLCNFA